MTVTEVALIALSWLTGIPALLAHIVRYDTVTGSYWHRLCTRVALITAPIALIGFLARATIYQARKDTMAAGLCLFITFLLLVIFLTALTDDDWLNGQMCRALRAVKGFRRRRTVAMSPQPKT